MKTSRAYIAGLGTSGVLIASFVLLLAVVSAIVAFRGYPGEASNDGLDRLDVRQARPAAAVNAGAGERSRKSDTGSGSAALDRAAARSGRDTVRGAGVSGVAGERIVGGGATEGAGGGSSPGGGGSGSGGPGLPVGAGGGVPLRAPGAGDVTGGLDGVVGNPTDGLGDGVPRVTPPVAETGVGGVVEQAAPVVDGATDAVNGQVDEVTGQVGGVTGGLTGGR